MTQFLSSFVFKKRPILNDINFDNTTDKNREIIIINIPIAPIQLYFTITITNPIIIFIGDSNN